MHDTFPVCRCLARGNKDEASASLPEINKVKTGADGNIRNRKETNTWVKRGGRKDAQMECPSRPLQTDLLVFTCIEYCAYSTSLTDTINIARCF